MNKLKEIFKRENRDRSIPLLLLLFAVGVQGTLMYLFRLGVIGRFGLKDLLVLICNNQFSEIVLFTLMLTFPITLHGAYKLYTQAKGVGQNTILIYSLTILTLFELIILTLIPERFIISYYSDEFVRGILYWMDLIPFLFFIPIVLLLFTFKLFQYLYKVGTIDENEAIDPKKNKDKNALFIFLSALNIFHTLALILFALITSGTFFE